ncbi:receptor kinase-like protein Xa21 isoform X12 [Citrus sinensis]|uniref:receptor kinase-like protein Xa21 isoform X12 n=1 Tax=Citrus sinensis TaxID=2711 RepID=UPI0003D78E07|nr:receptor kinase-like protein Xa21 isoform X12 [Citrus sinensis]
MSLGMMIRFLLLRCFTLSFIIASANTTSITTDRDALLAFKAHITHDPTNFVAKNWSTSTSVCNWTGVTCDVYNHRVTALNISLFGLTGTIPSQLGNLSSLQSLNLSHNRLSGAIPSSIFSINSLQILDLSDNQLSGSFPSSISNMSSLTFIDFSSNTLSDQLSPNICNHFPNLESLLLKNNTFNGEIPSTLSNCRQLRKLYLSLNQFTGAIPKEIGKLTRLSVLSLRDNKFQGEIPQELGNLAKLEQLWLQSNFLNGTIPSSIFKFSFLLYLDLSNNSLRGTVPKEIGNVSHLKWLYLHYNRFLGAIPKEIGNLTKLLRLSLQDNKFQGEIPHELGNLAELETLSLQNNSLTGTIPSSIFKLSSLLYLDFSNNNLRGTIPKEIGNLTNLKELSLYNNRFKGEIPHEIGNLRDLEWLELSDNKLVGVVPATIFNLSTLKVFAVSNNSLSGSLQSSADVQLPNLEGIYLWGNNFSGTIPSFIFNASKLSTLALGDNSFFGFIPNTFGNLGNLRRFNIENNYLTSSTPELNFLSSLSNSKYLKVLELSYNPLNGILPRTSMGNLSHSLEKFVMINCNVGGAIPEEISNLTNLRMIGFSGNKLNGSIPITLGKLQKLQLLSFRDNKLEGSIPEDVCSLAELYQLHLGGNKLSRSIPTCIGNLTSLRTLSLGSNELISVIPSTLWNLEYIMNLNFSSNFLTGPLPLEIGNLKVLVGIDFSMNNFSGAIPTTIGGLAYLQYLLLGHNKLEGSIPNPIGDLISLEYLDLSNNNLSGPIPVSLEKLLYLKDLNLSFNNLEGEIPKGGSFGNFSAKSFEGNKLLCGSPNLQVPPCKTSIHHTSRKNALLLGIVLPLSIVSMIVVILLISRYRKRGKQLPNDANMPPVATWRRFSYLELFQATDGFSENNLIGRGSFGSVYKARIQDGMEVAVKVFHLQCGGVFKSFDVECEVMKSIRHRNLIKIISTCSNDDFKALVLEYMPHGSLEKCLYSSNCILDIFQRLNIMIDIAVALEYLHFGYSALVIHCDLKPSNVLLDDNMVAHLSDFGIAKLLTGEDQSKSQTQTLATIGYMAPEYGREGRVSTNGDVYSFGIMLMETFTKKKPTDKIFAGEMTLKYWVSNLLPISVMEIVDANLLSREDKHFAAKEQCVSFVFNLAMECTVESAEQRINAKEIVTRLLKIRDSLLICTRESKLN